MPRYIIKLDEKYLEWSTIVDAPVTYGMTEKDFSQYYKEQYGIQGYENDYRSRMERVNATGTSAFGYKSVDELIRNNRAGKNEENLSKEEIIQHFCV